MKNFEEKKKRKKKAKQAINMHTLNKPQNPNVTCIHTSILKATYAHVQHNKTQQSVKKDQGKRTQTNLFFFSQFPNKNRKDETNAYVEYLGSLSGRR